MIDRRSVVAGLIGGGVALAIAALSSGPVIRAYILANPEVLPEAMQRLQDRELAEVVNANRAAIETPFAGAWAGAADGDVVLVEFFDYACGFCRKSNADLERLLQEDPKLKVVWREYPVLGEDSLAAAEASLAAARAGRFRPFYDRLFASGRPDAAAVAEARKAAGIPAAPAPPEFRAEIEKNYRLAQALRASGTPTFVVGDRVLHGAVGYETLKQAIAEARSERS